MYFRTIYFTYQTSRKAYRIQEFPQSCIVQQIGKLIIQRNVVFRSKGNVAYQIMWYAIAFVIITCIVNSINCVWIAVAGQQV